MPGLLRGIARTAVVAGTASAVGGRVRHRQDQKWARQDAQAAPTEPQSAEPQYAEPQYAEPEQSSAPPAKDRLQQLKELGELKVQGVLTEQGLATEKTKILAG
jgi:hypothetical protein